MFRFYIHSIPPYQCTKSINVFFFGLKKSPTGKSWRIRQTEKSGKWDKTSWTHHKSQNTYVYRSGHWKSLVLFLYLFLFFILSTTPRTMKTTSWTLDSSSYREAPTDDIRLHKSHRTHTERKKEDSINFFSPLHLPQPFFPFFFPFPTVLAVRS
jgi:hypothetical protein